MYKSRRWIKRWVYCPMARAVSIGKTWSGPGISAGGSLPKEVMVDDEEVWLKKWVFGGKDPNVRDERINIIFG